MPSTESTPIALKAVTVNAHKGFRINPSQYRVFDAAMLVAMITFDFSPERVAELAGDDGAPA